MKNFIPLFFLALTALNCKAQNECVSRDYGNDGTVCVCTSDHCDTIPRPEKVDQTQYLIYTSNKGGLRFDKKISEFETSGDGENQIRIDPELKYQTILGFGGAFTDATGININSLEEELQDKLLRSYFSEDGIEYSMCRVPIGGTDFSTHGYSYDDGDVDQELTNFALAEEDYEYKIPYILKAKELTENNIRLFASAWTAPKWMKTNGEYAGYGFIKQEFYQSWADYFVKFLDSYQEEEITFWGITTGNEPNTILVPNNQINDVGWNSTEMGKWVLNNLGPTIRSSNHSDIKVMIFDDQRIFLPSFVDEALEDDASRQYIDGIAVHWYFDFLAPSSFLSDTHDHFPDKFILATEACTGSELFDDAVVLGSWDRGESYSSDIIDDLLHWVNGWVDWNMVLDLGGGPTYIDNFVDSPIIVNATSGEFYKQPMFYHLGHFSKFVPRDSVRIDSNSSVSNVMVVAFRRPDDGTAVVVLNTNEEAISVSIVDESKGTAKLELSGHSITTVLYWQLKNK